MGFVLIAAFLYSIPCVYPKWDALMLSNPSLLKTFGFLVRHREVSVPHPHLPPVQGVSLYREPLADAAAPQFKAWALEGDHSHTKQQQGSVAGGSSAISYSSFFIQGKNPLPPDQK